MKFVFYILILSLYIGCAAKELVVRNADTMIEYQVTKRLPLYPKQKDELSKDIDAFLNNEKAIAKEILPVIDQLNLDKPHEIDEPYNKLSVFYRKLSKDFSTVLAKHMVTLSKIQQKEFFANLDEENKKFADKTQKERRQEAQNNMEKFFGDLNDNQVDIIKSYDEFYKKNNEMKLIRRKELHANFKKILEGSLSDEEKRNALLSAYLAHQDTNFEESKVLEIAKKIIPTLTKDQKKTFREKASEVKEVLRYFIQANY